MTLLAHLNVCGEESIVVEIRSNTPHHQIKEME